MKTTNTKEYRIARIIGKLYLNEVCVEILENVQFDNLQEAIKACEATIADTNRNWVVMLEGAKTVNFWFDEKRFNRFNSMKASGKLTNAPTPKKLPKRISGKAA